MIDDLIDQLAKAMGVEMIEADDLPGPDIPLEELTALGWSYVDPPGWFSPEAWDRLLSILGEGEYKVLVMSKHVTRGTRGQLFISPKARMNISEYRKKAAH